MTSQTTTRLTLPISREHRHLSEAVPHLVAALEGYMRLNGGATPEERAECYEAAARTIRYMEKGW